MKLRNQQVGQAGEHFVAAELHRRGAYAVTFSGNMPDIDIYASNVDRTRMIAIQVKTKTAGSWHTDTRRGKQRDENPEESEFWVFVDIGKDPDVRPDYFVVPAWWMQNSIFTEYQAYLDQHGGQRPTTQSSTHHAIRPAVLEEWREQWGILGTSREADVARSNASDRDGPSPHPRRRGRVWPRTCPPTPKRPISTAWLGGRARREPQRAGA